MQAGDRVLSVGGVPVRTWTEMQTEIQISGGKPTVFKVDRAGGEATLTLTPKRDEVSGAYYILAFSTTNNVRAAAWMPSRNPLKQISRRGEARLPLHLHRLPRKRGHRRKEARKSSLHDRKLRRYLLPGRRKR